LALWSLLTVVSGIARNFPQLFLARMGVGVGEAGCTPSAHSLIGDYCPGARRSMAISIYQCGATLGASAGMVLIGYLGAQLGWRAALQVIGVAGVPLAVLVLLTLRDPRSAVVTHAEAEPAMAALRALWARPAFTHLVLGYGIGGVSTYGVSQWMPTFLMRSFGMTVAEAGALGGAAAAVGGVLGLLVGGAIAVKLVARNERWELWWPALANVICLPLYLIIFLSRSAAVVLLLKAVAVFVGAAGAGVALSAVQSFAEPTRRATAISLLFFVTSLVSNGTGPYLIGMTSDLLAPLFGQESLRYALLLSCVFLGWSTLHFMLAARSSSIDRVF
jgi:MFS family permease